ncbi:four-helix bundle copper-binding protein [Paeniroseomonas aquatica]|uniref:Four-helix bundle copper-binding protein n=1 Tax=Paeniroseomonas aquatica TaxID=373043 RepID=A0ABT8A1D4_9PROT|nr:four-helix bundle copper-binding protein [Paeniroseomonas aquatica]MDN3563558.1 four-helix bundle copper-binding protein [Paeniroseomonas aquatica]
MELSTHIQLCLDCHRTCTASVIHLLHGGTGQGHDEQAHLVALLDCAQICVTCADFMTRSSPHHAHICRECADICEGCATLCEAHADPDGTFKRCAEVCRQCAVACREMSGHD